MNDVVSHILIRKAAQEITLGVRALSEAPVSSNALADAIEHAAYTKSATEKLGMRVTFFYLGNQITEACQMFRDPHQLRDMIHHKARPERDEIQNELWSFFENAAEALKPMTNVDYWNLGAK